MTVRVALDAKRDPRIVPDTGVRELPREGRAAAGGEAGRAAPAAAIVAAWRRRRRVRGRWRTRATARKLQLGRTLGDDREVLDGLSAGDQVVLDPPKLADGAKVKVAPASDAESDAMNDPLPLRERWKAPKRRRGNALAPLTPGATLSRGREREMSSPGQSHAMSALVHLRNLTKIYQRGPEKVEVLHGIDSTSTAATPPR